MKGKLEKLQERFLKAKTEAERATIQQEIGQLCDTDAAGVATAALDMIRQTNDEIAGIVLRKRLKDILPAISLAYVAKTYFGKSRQWLYQRINGNLVNGKPARFTPAELRTLDAALKDLAARLSEIRVF